MTDGVDDDMIVADPAAASADASAGDQLQMHWFKLFLGLIPITTILGNILVILSVLRFKSLQTAVNFLIFGLAFADLFVAVFVMPYAVYIEISGGMWFLGDLMCNIYSASDVACSTASILILAVISFDRYRAVSKPIAYSRQTQNIVQVFYMLGAIWLVSIAVASPIVLGANTRPEKDPLYECRLYNPLFIILSSIVSFVIPCFVVLFVYLRILQELRKREKAAKIRHSSNANTMSMQSSCATSCNSTASLDEPGRLNNDADETALCKGSGSLSGHTSTRTVPSTRMISVFRYKFLYFFWLDDYC
ncbi:unnamed protein product [Enterobius vermicularis]|uniref:G_PROTEIN_RECEP_F1_2 domain-containing protein n=1 Tax=Enterobius vermicularis TaxID=51028 RepID=A0A0N4V9I7_ENTVE|nr:unnamed protein product [Enterobius vermicularis]